ncbi:MAG: efflux RND transporter periplasmic adaptor subunit, partial [Gammaproteobacteria bacterium]
ETEGRVEKLNAKRGVQVRAGAPLLTMDMRDRSARFEQARASVIEHRTSYQGQLRLKKDGYVSDAQIAETLAKLEAAKAELVRAELDMDNRIVRAPFNGVLQEREVEVGDFVRSGDKVATFVDNTKIIVIGSVAEQAAVNITQGETAVAKLITGEEVKGKIRYLSPVADIATRTFQVELEIPNWDGRLAAGVTAELLLPGGEILAHKISPALLTLDPDGNIGIKTVDQFDQVEFHTVNSERSETDGVWVSGLPETANVITVGQGYVAAGQRVSGVFAESETALAAEKTTSKKNP